MKNRSKLLLEELIKSDKILDIVLKYSVHNSLLSDSDIVSVLMVILDSESLKNLLTVYGGQTIKVPSIDDIRERLSEVSLFYYVEIENYSIDEYNKLSNTNFTQEDYNIIKTRMEKLLLRY